jgi:hypothetical protein
MASNLISRYRVGFGNEGEHERDFGVRVFPQLFLDLLDNPLKLIYIGSNNCMFIDEWGISTQAKPSPIWECKGPNFSTI